MMFDFGRKERLKRLEAENKLAEALEKLELYRKAAHETEVVKREKVQVEQERDILRARATEIEKELRKQAENDLIVASLKLVKALVIDERPKKDPMIVSLMDQQRAAMQNIRRHGGNAYGLSSILGRALF